MSGGEAGGKTAPGSRWPYVAIVIAILAGVALVAFLWRPDEPTGANLVPEGITAFFEGRDCPDGWQPVADGAGRLILGTTNSELVGRTAGTPLGDHEDRTHAHTYSASLKLAEQRLAALNGPNKSGAKKGTYKNNGKQVGAARSGLPFMQLRFCEPEPGLVESARAGTWPYLSVAFFRAGACPPPWEPYAKANGRFIIPISSESSIGAVVGTPYDGLTPALHLHAFSKELVLTEQHYVLFDGCCNTNLGARKKNGKHTLSGKTGLADAATPNLALMACILREEEVPMPSLPQGFTLFLGQKICPVETGWHEAIGSKGRYLVALPEGGDPGVAFGGDPLGDGEMRTHTHPASDSVTLTAHGIAGASGCGFSCGNEYVKADTYRFDAATAAAAINMPYVPLRHCVRR